MPSYQAPNAKTQATKARGSLTKRDRLLATVAQDEFTEITTSPKSPSATHVERGWYGGTAACTVM